MQVELSPQTIDAIAQRAALIIVRKLKKQIEQPPEMVTTSEAAQILGISPGRMRKIADRFPHIKQGDSKQGKLLFVRKALLENY